MGYKKGRTHQLSSGDKWVQPSGSSFTHVCCDCGQAHNIQVDVLNAEELKVQYFAYPSYTRETRAVDNYAFVPEDANTRMREDFLYLLNKITSGTNSGSLRSLVSHFRDRYGLHESP